MFHVRAPAQDVSFPDGVIDDGAFPEGSESPRGSLLLNRGASQQGPLPTSPLPQPPNPGSGHGEDGHPTLPTGELAPGAIEVPVSL